MRRLLLGALLALSLALPAGAAQMLQAIVGDTHAAPSAPYAGVIDVKSGAYVCWSLRACSLAKATAHASAIDLLRNDAATCTVVLQDSGDLDLTTTSSCNSNTQTVTAWMSGHTATISQFYDQTGNSRHATQSTAGLQAAFKLPGACPGTMPASKPCAINASGGYYFSGVSLNNAVPYTMVGTFYEGASPAVGGRLFSTSGFTYQTIADYTTSCAAQQLAAYLGTALCSATYTTQKWYSFQNCSGSSTSCSGGVGAITVGTSTTTGNTGTSPLTGNSFNWMADAVFGNNFVGAFTEMAFWLAGKTAGETTGLQANTDTYWGY